MRPRLTSILSAVRAVVSRMVWPRAGAGSEVVVCHEWLVGATGSDKVAARLVELTGAHLLFCFAADPEVVSALGIQAHVVESRLGRLARRERGRRLLLPVMPLAWRMLDLSDVRLVVTSSHSCVNAVRSAAATRVSYCHTPMRYAWDWRLEAGRVPRWGWPALVTMAAIFRRADKRWSSSVDVFVANSSFVANRICRYYGRPSTVIHPPIDVDYFSPAKEPHDRSAAPFLFAGRLVAYKRPDLAIAAASRAAVPIAVLGNGSELGRLKSAASNGVSFHPNVTDDELRSWFRRARALVFPGIEDFGMVAVEAMACGCPVVARAAGGILDVVQPGVHGVLVASDDLRDWADVLRSFRSAEFTSDELASSAREYSVERFDEAMRTVLRDASVPPRRSPDSAPR